MDEIETCRIVHGNDKDQPGNLWWEARLVTPEGEKTILRARYQDERFEVDKEHVWGKAIDYILTHGLVREDIDKEISASEKLRRQTHARLVGYLMKYGWKPAGSEADGLIKLMKRKKPEDEAD